MFLDLNGVLVKFWKEQGRPDKEIKIELLERMLNWYKKMGYVTLDKQEQPSEKTCKNCGFYENNCPYIRGKFIPYPSKVCKDYTYSVIKEQEQPCDTCTNDKGCVTCKDGELWEGKPEVDLEKEIKTWIPAHIVGGDEAPWKELKGVVIQWSEVVARYFYILGLKNNIPVTQITLDELAKEGEPVNKDLEEAAEKFVYDWAGLSPTERRIAKRAYLAGAEWQKEQMMKDAWEREVKIDSGGYPYIDITAELYDYEHDVPLAKRGELVKIIIVKED